MNIHVYEKHNSITVTHYIVNKCSDFSYRLSRFLQVQVRLVEARERPNDNRVHVIRRHMDNGLHRHAMGGDRSQLLCW
jgi:chemotaxis response regulator CheB